MIRKLVKNDDGYAMVLALVFITVLGLLATIVVTVSTSEKRVAFNDYTHARAFYSADAGGEAAINWLSVADGPPGLLDDNNYVYVPAGYDTLDTDHLYRHDITYIQKMVRPGWGIEFKDFVYRIESEGTSAVESSAELELRATRLFKEGY